MAEIQQMYLGKQLQLDTGMLADADLSVMSSPLFYKVCRGSHIRLENQEYEYTFAFYSVRRPEEYIYSYAYQPEQNWACFKRKLSALDAGFITQSSVIGEEGYIRISIRRKDRRILTERERDAGGSILSIETEGIKKNRFCSRKDVRREIDVTVEAVRRNKTEGTLAFMLLTDTHYTVNGTWEDTISAMRAVAQMEKPDAVIHLGDLTDGMLDKKCCWHYSHRVLNGIRSLGVPFYMVVGNHDTNYFMNNPQPFTDEEIYSCYLEDIKAAGNRCGQLWYYEDFPEGRLRCIMLHSFDYREKVRYGYPEEEIIWAGQVLDSAPPDWKIIFFSHDAPIARLDYWAKEIRNGDRLLSLIEEWHGNHGKRVMAFIHGHTHADYVFRERAFPILSIGCSKCEYFTDKKPEKAATARRIPGTISQELWDIMLVNTQEGRLELIRFGAGQDRKILENMKMSDENARLKNTVKIWAHRGASGYAPENTLEAFLMAAEMGADGVELDVQFTKDRQLVVIHDEKIDRVSDGSGRVVDYTLEELRRFRFNRTHPEYHDAFVPTLREVLELLKPTGLTINIELKTGINFYDGIEDSVLRLVEEMGMEERIIYSSFNHYSVLKVKELSPGAKTGFLYSDGILDVPEYAQANKVEAIHPAFHNMQYRGLAEECREKGIKLHVWTVNSPEDMKQAADNGADAIITNYPDIAYEVLRGHSAPESALRKESEGRINEEKASPNKSFILHVAGIVYGRVRKGFVAIDRVVQKAAGK